MRSIGMGHQGVRHTIRIDVRSVLHAGRMVRMTIVDVAVMRLMGKMIELVAVLMLRRMVVGRMVRSWVVGNRQQAYYTTQMQLSN